MELSCNCKALFYTVIFVSIFFFFILPYLDSNQKVEHWTTRYAEVDEKVDNSIDKIDQKMCSVDCCKHTQWLPKELNEIKNRNIDKNYVGTNLTCNNGTGGGCVCMKKENITMLSNKSGNTISQCNN